MGDAFDAAQEEWDRVREIVPGFSNRTGGGRGGEVAPSAGVGGGDAAAAAVLREKPLLTFRTAAEHVKPAAIAFKPSAEEAVSRRRQSKLLLACSPCLLRSQQPEPRVLEAMRWAAAFTRVSFDDSDPAHFQTLLTLYKLLTGDRLDCPRYGSHWELIGFQGNDPATDLRGMGLLGLLQPLFLVTTPELLPLARRLHRISRGETQEFPLMVLLINLTRIAFDSFMEGKLDGLFNPHSPVMGIASCSIGEEEDAFRVFNVFFAAVVSHYHNVWVTGHKTIKDSGYVLQGVEDCARKHPAVMIRNLAGHLSTYPRQEVEAARRDLSRRTGATS